MPDSIVDVRDAALEVSWDGETSAGRGRLRLTDHEAIVDVASAGKTIRAPFHTIRGADLRSGALTMYALPGHVTARGARIDLAWVTLQQRACLLPEFTVGLRALGSRHGGDAALQGRFFAPLLSARRRLEEQHDLLWRLAAFDAEELRARTVSTLRELVAERTGATAAFRRSLDAQVTDEAEGLYRALDALGRAGEEVRHATDAERFEVWRAWAVQARMVFTEADRCWLAVRPLLESIPAAAKRRRRGIGGSGAALALLSIGPYLGRA